ncbi:MAG: ester cyclase [Sediminibacterium sp.]|nr:ester cyclase [Sediminibacterium sp.]MBX9780243.1 ester cyclase [Chitinophagaceae bacterium]
MRQLFQVRFMRQMLVLVAIMATLAACKNSTNDKSQPATTDSVAANIKLYSHVWDEIINHGKFELFNDSNFAKNVVMHVSPADIVGIDSAKAYYSNYVTGFSNVKFTIKDVFGMGNKLVKHWNFKGTHTGVFFGIKPTGKEVNIDGVTLVRMENGKIAEERDFFDNLQFMQQLGLIPR